MLMLSCKPWHEHYISLLAHMRCCGTGPHTCLPTLHSPCRFTHVWLVFQDQYLVLMKILRFWEQLHIKLPFGYFKQWSPVLFNRWLHPSTIWCLLLQPTFHSLQDFSFQSTHFLDALVLASHLTETGTLCSPFLSPPSPTCGCTSFTI